MPGPERKSFDTPDELREVDHGSLRLVRVGTQTIGRGVLQPGWRWSTHMQPAMGTASCPVHHVQVLLSGSFAYRMDGGDEVLLTAGDVVDIPPGHDAWVVGDEPATMIDIGGNIGAIALGQEHERVVTTLLITDIVDSTPAAARLGDQAWRQVLAEHDRVVRSQLDRFHGTEVATTGDGFLATFSSAIGALRCADAIRSAVPTLGIEVRIGVHTGEISLIGPGEIGGIAVNATARIMALAGGSEVLASAITRGLVDGSDLSFEDVGTRELKGFDRPFEVVRLV
jgi:class 3 adenylate cyclase